MNKKCGGEKMYCGRCGREIKDTAKFCPYCGNQVAVAPAAVSHPGTKNRKMLIIIGFGLVVIAAVMIGIMVKIYLGGKIENRIVGSWAPAVRDYNTGEYRIEKEMHNIYIFGEDGTFQKNGTTGTYEIYDDRIYLYETGGYSWGEWVFLEDAGYDDGGTSLERWALENELPEYDDILIHDGADKEVYVKIDD